MQRRRKTDTRPRMRPLVTSTASPGDQVWQGMRKGHHLPHPTPNGAPSETHKCSRTSASPWPSYTMCVSLCALSAVGPSPPLVMQFDEQQLTTHWARSPGLGILRMERNSSDTVRVLRRWTSRWGNPGSSPTPIHLTDVYWTFTISQVPGDMQRLPKRAGHGWFPRPERKTST